MQTRLFLKQALLSIVLMGLAVQGNAQHNGFAPVKDLVAFKADFKKESSAIRSITSNFTQEKVLTALTEKMTSSGTFRFKRDSKVRLEYTKPFSYLMVMNGDKMLVRDDNKESRMNMKNNKLFQQINRIMVDCLQGTILDSKDFTTKVFENDKLFLLEMTPVSKSLKNFFQNIVLKVEKSDYSVQSMLLNEPGGDYTILTFTDKKLNVTLPDEVFTL